MIKEYDMTKKSFEFITEGCPEVGCNTDKVCLLDGRNCNAVWVNTQDCLVCRHNT